MIVATACNVTRNAAIATTTTGAILPHFMLFQSVGVDLDSSSHAIIFSRRNLFVLGVV